MKNIAIKALVATGKDDIPVIDEHISAILELHQVHNLSTGCSIVDLDRIYKVLGAQLDLDTNQLIYRLIDTGVNVSRETSD